MDAAELAAWRKRRRYHRSAWGRPRTPIPPALKPQPTQENRMSDHTGIEWTDATCTWDQYPEAVTHA
ncbi:hypothetical protein FDI16_gp071 [Mycobacterium phage Shauna1]|uniref:Uncharacterized protein n=2 Tax=Mycobacterium virus Shauna1 TaxID=1993889 RepID=G1DU52_9CAUD|nr:hypothetical protein FDI16_gp071 [Mycobacterium phage Shauna1]AEJ93042.1 hypothetical protein SHAUNA1_71 [Mycobacterium phage Shauna1]QIQ63759.1 hypothetical protein SEA_PHANPHAGIA_70 [Mycobacterium phage Phanphagia]